MQPPPTEMGSRGTRQPGSQIRVFVLAEIRFYREGLARFLSAQPGVEVVGTAQDAAITVDSFRRTRLDVVLLDLAGTAGVDAARALAAVAPAAGIVALAVGEDEREVVSLAEAGVSGFVARDASLDELRRAVESAASGESRCSPRVTAMLARRVSSLARQMLAEPAEVPLTRRQLEIVGLIGKGLANKEIAQRLVIEVSTVKNHVHSILERLEVQSRDDAVGAVRALSAGARPRPFSSELGPASPI